MGTWRKQARLPVPFSGRVSSSHLICYASMSQTISRREVLALATAAVSQAAPSRKQIPIGLELFSVREEIKQDLPAAVRAVAQMGYDGVEFWAPYFDWTPVYAKEVRRLLDDLKVRCLSTHNAATSLAPENLPKAMELNQILGSKIIIMAHPGKVEGLDGWKAVTDTLAAASERVRSSGLRAGFHNHPTEWKPVDGKRPIDMIAAGTPNDFVLQLDTATCLASGGDPVAFVKANPGKVRSYHMKDWSSDPAKGYKVLLGEGICPWKELIAAAESVGGVEHYLIEQEGSRYAPMETAKRCLENLRYLRAT